MWYTDVINICGCIFCDVTTTTYIYPSVHSSSIVLYFAVKLKLYNSTCSRVHDLALNLGVKILSLALLVLIS